MRTRDAVLLALCPCSAFRLPAGGALGLQTQTHSSKRSRQPPVCMAGENGDKEQPFSIPNPFKDTFQAGRNLRETIDDALDQFTGGKSSRVSVCCKAAGCINRWSCNVQLLQAAPWLDLCTVHYKLCNAVLYCSSSTSSISRN